MIVIFSLFIFCFKIDAFYHVLSQFILYFQIISNFEQIPGTYGVFIVDFEHAELLFCTLI